MKQLTLKELAPLLGGNYWEKGDRKRIYLREGYNTKKMKTTTYVTQTDEGEFIACCYIDCLSQNYGWISSQEKIIKERVREKINFYTADKFFYIKHKTEEHFYGTDDYKWDHFTELSKDNIGYSQNQIQAVFEDMSNDEYEIIEISATDFFKAQNEHED